MGLGKNYVYLSADQVEGLRGYFIVWLADVATTYLINARLNGALIKEKAGLLCEESRNIVGELKKRIQNVCNLHPLPLTGNDKKEDFSICNAVDMICGYSDSRKESIFLQPALSLEFTEYVRTFMPRKMLRKKDVVKVEPILHGLAVMGAYLSHAYLDDQRHEWGYVFIDVPNPEAINYRKLSGMAIQVTKSVNQKEGDKLSLLVGVASAVALIYKSALKSRPGSLPLKANFVRLVKQPTQNKVMLKAFEVLDLSSLARRVYEMNIALPVYSLISNYPSGEGHVLRSFVQRLSRAIVMSELLNDYTEIYSAYRVISSENFLRELKTYENWRNILDGLLQVRIPM
ncbi:MAG: hypothetical protein QW579_01620 [Desulfurococcaceae archaeon]